MLNKGLTLTIIFEAESANYGESLGNVSSLKKVTRKDGEQHTYISRQAIRHNIMEQYGEDYAPVEASGSGEKKVIQFAKDARIDKYPEIDFFGYLKTEKGTSGRKRSAKVRLSNAISTAAFKSELDFLTNKGLADRMKEDMSIAQAEIHKSYYVYTLVVDLDQIGIDENDNIYLDSKEKARRVNKLMDTIAFLYRDIRGRRENLAPLFIIGGVYSIKNPIFENLVTVKGNKIPVVTINDGIYGIFRTETFCGLVKGKFDNDNEILEKLSATSMPEFFENIKIKVNDYYESNKI